MFEKPRKSRSTSGFTGTLMIGSHDWVLWIFVIFSLPAFLRSRNPFSAVSQSYHVWVISKIQVNSRIYRCLRVQMIEAYGFLLFCHSLRFWGHGIRKSRSTSGFTIARGYPLPLNKAGWASTVNCSGIKYDKTEIIIIIVWPSTVVCCHVGPSPRAQ